MKSILFFSENLKIFEKRAENEYLHPNGTSEVSHNWKLPKIRIFALNSRCASWVPKAILGHFWDFFQKSNDLKKIFAKKLFLDFGHLVAFFKAKNAKNGDFRLKNGYMQKFLWPEISVVGGEKNSARTKNTQKCCQKHFQGADPIWGL